MDLMEKHLIQRIRDEAHRFAVEYHRKKRSKKMISSELDSVQGIGPKKEIINVIFWVHKEYQKCIIR